LDREQFEDKWDNLKIFIQYGMLSDEKFYEKAEKFALLKNVDGKYFTFEEYKDLVKENQQDKNKDLIYLYTTNKEEQYSYIQHAKEKGYDVLIMDGQLDVHVVSQLEQKFEKTRFVRVDSDTVEKLIQKEEVAQVSLTDKQKDELITIFKSQLPAMEKVEFIVSFEQLSETANPVFVTQNEFMRRMKEMSAMQGGMMSFYGEMPNSYNLVVNTGHPLVNQILSDEETSVKENITPVYDELSVVEEKQKALKDSHKDKKADEIPTEEKTELDMLNDQISLLKEKKDDILKEYALGNKQVRQLIDLALLANNMLKGEALANFVKRSIDLM